MQVLWRFKEGRGQIYIDVHIRFLKIDDGEVSLASCAGISEMGCRASVGFHT